MAAREVRSFAVTVPAGTAQSAAVTLSLDMPQRIVNRVVLAIPPGPNGTVGVQLANSGTQVIPYQPGEWIVANDETIEWDLDGYIDSGSWQLIGYNVGQFSHTIQVRFDLQPVAGTVAQSTSPTATVQQINQTAPPVVAGTGPDGT